ncbi:Utp21-domain-containing protein [Dichomitus squalens LYAD-421 SS1]|uniref:Utp21-domain-containing protein n=1 Tax=Dichomitus squalens (strain LYAD-421) TaxID=732165 RepID=UPI0004411B45|nr:Utp21-domain-containing protein [Dichomitus squalens LYAD-421 SS1]EJF66083.1 Utp21-domain-containing protein [Dichomitus squalens LYAD-421 SS1]
MGAKKETRSSPPPRKRARVEAPHSPNFKQGPRLFAPFRALGLITNNVPFVLQTRSHKGATDGPRIHLLTCLGRAWALWEGGKMGLLFVGPDAPGPIASMAMDGNAVWVSSGLYVMKYIRGKEVARLTNPLETSLTHILVFGPQLLAVTDDGNRMLVWDTESEELQTTIQFEPGFTAIMIHHPATYLNKVLVASSEGSMQLWNIRTQTLIHTFPAACLLTSPSKTTSTAITALARSPAIDVIGIGFSSGEISVYDIRADERLMRMVMQDGGIRAMSFRSDSQPILATASSTGHIALWDLNSGGRLLHIVRGAHDGAVTALEWVPGQPVLISSGEDNSVKQWLFDSPTEAPRLLKFRSGHHAPPHLIRYYGEDGKQLLTASRDRSLRCTSVVRDSRSFELSQGSLAKKATNLSIPIASLKFPAVTTLSYSATRAKDWDDILTAHTDEAVARTWTMKDKRVGKHVFNVAAEKKKGGTVGSVKAVCVTACGNFGITASSTGIINMYNMQSGILRRTFDIGPCPANVPSRFRPAAGKKKEERCVTGLASDALDRTLVASTLDGTINFFDFHTAALEHTLVLPSAAVSITLHRDSGLLAVICDDLVVRVVDIETRRVVREFGGFRGRVLDVTFSPDSRWLVTTSLDSIIRTFDMPTGRLIDAFRTSSVATSISFSPTNDFLATAHVDSVGVYLWANRAQYSEVPFQSIVEEDVTDISLPSMQGLAEDEALDALSALTVEDKPADVFTTPPQLDGELVTFTLLPRSRWQTLLNLEVIQQRNKPKEPPKQPEKAPFFLPTLPGVEQRFAVDQQKAQQETKKPTKRLQRAAGETESVFHKKLAEAHESHSSDYEEFFNYAKALSPAAMDLELRSLVSLDSLRMFIGALTSRLLSHRDFEAVQTFMNVFLRMHGDVLTTNEELRNELETLAETQRKKSERLLELLASSLGTLGFVRDTM